jgi:Fic family protein
MKPFIAERLPLTDIDWPSLVPLIGQANRAIALYDGILYGVPNPEVLLSPLTTQEAVLSSRMEGTQATLGDVLKFEAGAEVAEESKRQDIQEIINYRRALQTAEEELKRRPFNLNLLLQLHGILLDSVRGRNKARGQFRTEQNWIGPPGSTIQEARFVPPTPLLLKDHLDNWEKYYHGEERDPLVQLAIVHAQFEIIHPFLDGNGRLGRILVPLFLHEKQLLSRPMFYISSYLEANRDEYVAGLRDLGRPKSWDRWIEFVLRAVTEQAKANSATARAIIELYERLKIKLIELTHSRYAVPLLDHLFDQPIFQSSQLTRHRQMPSLPTVMQMLRRLRKAHILKTVRKSSGRQAEIFAFVELLNLCEGKKVM